MQRELIGLHAIPLIRTLVLDMIFSAFHKSLDSIASSQRNTAPTHIAPMFHRDSKCLADAGKSAVSQGYGQTGKTLDELRGTENLPEDVLLLREAKRHHHGFHDVLADLISRDVFHILSQEQ